VGRAYSSPIEALVSGSACKFAFDLDLPSLPIPGVPSIPIPDFPPELPLNIVFCPLDDSPEPKVS
jgi:hypothetical protein